MVELCAQVGTEIPGLGKGTPSPTLIRLAKKNEDGKYRFSRCCHLFGFLRFRVFIGRCAPETDMWNSYHLFSTVANQVFLVGNEQVNPAIAPFRPTPVTANTPHLG